MRLLSIIARILLVSWSSLIFCTDHNAEIEKLRVGLNDPEAYLKQDGNLIVMGNASLDNAQIVFLPEIHDDPRSLTTQLMLIAREKNKGQPFIVLDESLASMKKSMWDIFSQKSMEVLAAIDQRSSRQAYIPQQFEVALQNLATKFRNDYNQLNFLEGSGLWVLNNFSENATPFYGWDTTQKTTLVQRNLQMVNTLKTMLDNNNDRILIMAGARHIPELEFMTSQRLLCRGSKFATMGNFFNTVKQRFGEAPELRNGVGATLPIHNFLSKHRYAIVFQKPLYTELDRIVNEFKSHLGASGCMNLTR